MDHQLNDCEVIVLGSGLGGLIAATLLVKKRHRVLLLKEKAYQPSYRREGYRFGPFSNFSEKRLRPSLLQRISQELGLPPVDKIPGRDSPARKGPGGTKERVPFQVILPEARIDLFADLSLSKMEWMREFPRELTEIEAVYDELGKVQALLKASQKGDPFPFFPLEKRSLIRKWFPFLSPSREGTNERLFSLSREFNEFVLLQLISWGSLFSDLFPTSLTAYLLLHEERGEWFSQLDMESLEEKIVDYFLQSGGEVEEIEKVAEVSKRWRQGFILTLEGDRRALQSKVLILNMPLHSSADLFGKDREFISRWLERIRPRYVLFPCFLGIRDKAVPFGMRNLLVSMQDMEKSCEEGNVLFLSLSPAGDEGAAPEGRRALTVQSLVPFGTFRSWNQVAFAYHQQSVMKHLNHLIPFLEQFLEFTDFDWANEHIRRWSYPHFLYETTAPFDWREGVIPIRLSPRLYFTGKENFPYLGVEGEVLSGLMVAEQILRK